MLSLFYFLLFYQSTFGSHFDGGSIRWVPISKNATLSPVQILITQSYSYTLSLVTCTVGSLLGNTAYGYNFSLWCINNCGNTSAGYVAPTVLGYCTGSNSALNLAFVQRSDIVNLTANDYFTISYSIPSTATLGYYRSLILSNGTNFTAAHWSITATIDIRPRADDGLINTPPSATVMSPYGIPCNITTQIIIPTMDVDGDDVRCRWSNSSSECGNVCYPLTTPIGTTLSSNCTLTITGTSVGAWYCASIQVEDFLNTSTSLPPMSSTPIQFLIYVYKSKNCSNPTLKSPSTCVGAQVGHPTTVTLTAINSCGSSSNISSIAIQTFSGIVEGPLVLITPNKTVYAMNITYTPLAYQVGLQILCATALDNTNIPSTQYCITFIVGSTSIPACPGTTTTTHSTQTSTQTQTMSTRTVTSTSSKSSDTLQTNATSAMYDDQTSPYTEIISLGAMTDSLTSFEAVQTSETSTMYGAQISTYMEITSIAVETSSLTSTQILQTTADETTSELKVMSTTITTTSTSKSKTYNWPFIGSLIALFSLLTLLGSCCLCYHLLWSPAARRRRQQQQQEKEHRFQHRSVSEIGTELTKISRPPKPYQIFDVDVDSNNYSRLATSSSTITNSIRVELIKRSTLNKSSSFRSRSVAAKYKNDSNETNSSFNTNRGKSRVTVARIPNTKRRQSTSHERKIRQLRSSNILVTHVKK